MVQKGSPQREECDIFKESSANEHVCHLPSSGQIPFWSVFFTVFLVIISCQCLIFKQAVEKNSYCISYAGPNHFAVPASCAVGEAHVLRSFAMLQMVQKYNYEIKKTTSWTPLPPTLYFFIIISWICLENVAKYFQGATLHVLEIFFLLNPLCLF